MGASQLSITSAWPEPDHAVVRIVGEIDIATVALLDEALSGLLVNGCRYLVADLCGTAFCDASGLSSFVAAQRRIRGRDGWVRLAGLRPIVSKIFRITGLVNDFAIYDTVENAAKGRPHAPLTTGFDGLGALPPIGGPTGATGRSGVARVPRPRGRSDGWVARLVEKRDPESTRERGHPRAEPGHQARAAYQGGSVHWTEVATRFAEITSSLPPHGSISAALDAIAALAVRTVPNCDDAGLRLSRTPGARPLAGTGGFGLATEELQDELGEGPSVDPELGPRAVYVTDVAQDSRWPRFAARSAELGLGSLLTFSVATRRGVPGALTLYSRRPDAFDAVARDVGEVFAAHATIALAGVLAEAQLRRSMRTREMIGQAVGVVMERQGVTEEQAMDMLRRASQASHVRLPHLAHQVVSTTPVVMPAPAPYAVVVDPLER